MEIQRIDNISLFVDNTLSRPVQDFPKPRTVSSKTPWIKAPESAKEKAPHFSEAAMRLQEMDQQMDQIEKTASSVKEELNTMRRTLPPFPPGSEERVRILKGYIGLRKLIEQLTVPPEVPFIRFKEEISIPEMSDQASDQEWEKAIQALDKTKEAIQQKRASLESGIEV
ncbi:MAG: hypothetical protein A2Y79_06320 [Deltaproteobacteria bacterium RBG_13_43_22]|nr:MAG: hypothetical protein A2Y79_06320 [Deltaproteobacteria bacterium RBG_13_43_22]